jgi:hypothetical protein
MREIPLSQGKVALVDDEDFEWLSQWKWSLTHNYAFRRLRKAEDVACGQRRSSTHVTMHRAIMRPPVALDVDHINGDGLDNRRMNLRVASQQENLRNQGCVAGSGFKGVYLHKRDRCFNVVMRIDGAVKYLGYFKDAEKAARFYDDVARRHHGRFACVNFPRPGERSALTGEIIPELQMA